MVLLTLAVAATAWYLKEREGTSLNPSQTQEEQIVSDKGSHTIKNSADAKLADSNLPSELNSRLTEVKFISEEFDILRNCQLISHRNNDGDSFHVKHGQKETEFRLYFVDTAESQFKKYRDGNDNGKRIREQGEYFGGLDMQVTTEMGKIAKSFVTDLLASQNFTVVTKWENVYTPARKYCYVIVKWEDEDVYLHELLVAKGLVRIKTRGAGLPDKTNFYDQKKKLIQIEKMAKETKQGAWGI